MSRLQMIPERAYMDIFRDIVDEYLSEVTAAFQGLLSPAAEDGLEKAFWREAELIAGDTLERMALEIIARENPFAAYDSKLSTKNQKEEAASVVKEMLKRKEKIHPETLYRVMRSRFRLLADAFSEILRNIICRKRCGDTDTFVGNALR